MSSVTIFHTLWFDATQALDDQFFEKAYHSVIKNSNSVHILGNGKFKNRKSDHIADAGTKFLEMWYSWKIILHKPTITLVETIRNHAKMLQKIQWLDSIKIIWSHIQFIKILFLSLVEYWPLVWYHKTHYEMYETLLDVFLEKDKDQLLNGFEMKLWKFELYSIGLDRHKRDFMYQIITTMREVLCYEYPELCENYTSKKC